ncbi:MAG: hypothetical protein JWL83_552 [Actinomycetia bacterium]|nr:hypothetical protein [Actinomycetes bacterium]
MWLDAPFDGAARAGDLCPRHARALAPPRGWHVVDRREADAAAADAPANGAQGSRTPAIVPPPPVALPSPPVPAGWFPKFDSGDSLDGVLEATTPLLARAFRNVRAI